MLAVGTIGRLRVGLGTSRSGIALAILDQLSTPAAAAYGLRKLKADAMLAVRVRRSIDNGEADIGFMPEPDSLGNYWLDQTALLAHVGAGSGFITTEYDQSGNGRNATQATAANQPRIVNAGVVEMLGRPTLFQPNTNTRLNIPAFSGMTSALANAVYAQATTNNGSSPWQFATASPADHMPFTDGNAYLQPFSTTRMTFAGWSAPANQLIVASAQQTGTALSAFRNGTQIGISQNTPFLLPTTRTIFGGLFGTCYVSELIVLASAPSTADRQTLERNQGTAFGISVA